jgi:ribosomal protein S18 acetylase RimI-like enzyme
MKIRKATIADSPGLAKVQIDSYRATYAGILPQTYLDNFSYEEQSQDWRELLAGDMSDLLVVAVNDDGNVRGYLLGRLQNRAEKGFDCEVVALHVDPSFHRQGIGRRLLGRIAFEFQQQGCQSLMLSVLTQNHNARAVYEHLAGKLVAGKEIRFEFEGVELTEVVYAWEKIEELCS